jgi:predicted TIM-barrel enzyme
MCDIPRPPPMAENSQHAMAVRHATMAAAAASAAASAANTARGASNITIIGGVGEPAINPGDGSFQSLSTEAQAALVQQMGVNKLINDDEVERKPEETRISLSVVSIDIIPMIW